MILCMVVAALLSTGSAQPGTVYRFTAGDRSGTVWVMGDDARLESGPDETSPPLTRVEIWKAGGRQHLLLREQDRTYYDQVAYLAARDVTGSPSLHTLSVGDPFVISSVRKIQVDVRPSQEEARDTRETRPTCRPMSLKFSYELELRLKMADVRIPGRVEGSGEFCLADSLPVSGLPFGHGLELVSGIKPVDAVLADRLSSLKGVPIRRTLTVTRQIEGGERVSATSTIVLSDFQATDIPPDRFDVPKNYRYQEPVIVGPKRQHP